MRANRDKPVPIWKRRGRSILPANDEAEAVMRSIKDGSECIGDFKTIRSVPQLRLWWSLMRLLVDNGIFPSLESASDATKIGAGHVDMRFFPDTGEEMFVPRHINFGSLSQAEMNEVFQQALAVICDRWIGVDRDDLLAQVEEMLTPPEHRALGYRVMRKPRREAA
jgi:hypothetical protein